MLGSANQLKEERNIKLVGAVKGETDFDGSKNITITTIQDNIITLEGTIDLIKNENSDLTGNISIAYPKGFDVNNCVPIAVGITGSPSSNTYKDRFTYGFLDDKSTSYISGAIRRKVTLSEEVKLTVTYITDKPPENQTRKYKIVLMKIT